MDAKTKVKRVWLPLLLALVIVVGGAAGLVYLALRSSHEVNTSARVHFSGEVKNGLQWEFGPAQEVVEVELGQSYRTTYRLKNLTDQRITANAIRTVEGPEAFQDALHIIRCFCFVRQTLEPGEALELPVWFTVEADWLGRTVPSSQKEFYVHWDFYPEAEPAAD